MGSSFGVLSSPTDPRGPFGFANNLNGLLQKNGTGTSTFGLTFSNNYASSELEIRGGTIDFTEAAGQSAGETTIYRGAALQTASTFTVSGGTFQGAIQGSGASPRVLGNLELDGGDFYTENSGGAAPGVFVILGNFTQNGGTLHIYVNGNFGIDQLQISTQASLGGTLQVTTISAPINTPFTILIYGSVTNDFASFNWDSLQYTPNKQANRYQLS